MTRTMLVLGVILLAVFLPLAVLPIAIALFVAGTLVFVAAIAPPVSADVQPVALLALAFFRAPPSSR